MNDTASGAPARPYHHGDLKAALLRAAEAILERDGIQALTLRAAARAAGVSHAAPANHFTDLTGLFSELAAVGFARCGTALAAVDADGGDPTARMRAMGRAYVGFARAHPGLFALMFRSERLDGERAALRDAIAAFQAMLVPRATAPQPPLWAAAQAPALWSLVHGFAVLLLDGRLDATVAALPAPEGIDSLLEAVLISARLGA